MPLRDQVIYFAGELAYLGIGANCRLYTNLRFAGLTGQLVVYWGLTDWDLKLRPCFSFTFYIVFLYLSFQASTKSNS